MSPKLKRLSGSEVIAIFRYLGFSIESQRGSHVKMVRVTESGERQVLTITSHKELDTGTLHALVRQASRFISLDDLHKEFYTQ